MIKVSNLSTMFGQLLVGVAMGVGSAAATLADDAAPSGSVSIKIKLIPSHLNTPSPGSEGQGDSVLPSPGAEVASVPKNLEPEAPSPGDASPGDASPGDASPGDASAAAPREHSPGEPAMPPGRGEMTHPENVLRSPDRLENARVVPPLSKKKIGKQSIEPEGSNNGSECPGSPTDPASQEQVLEKDDLPLVQEEHPYDAPPVRSTDVPAKVIRRSDLTMNGADSALRDRIARVLHYHLTHPENLARRGPWAVMHASLPFGVETEVIAGNRRVNALGWMCFNGMCAKQRMFQPTKTGFRTNVGAGVQGHEGQFLAILAQSRVQSDYPIMIGERHYTIMDLVQYEMGTCREKSELTFKLIGLSHYLKPEQRWRDDQGRSWNLEKMVAEELAQPVVGAACGGTHRLMGLSFALARRQQAGLPIEGHWHRADVFVKDFVAYTLTLQNPDGSFSTQWFEGRGNKDDIERKLQTTGHIAEWLVFTVSDEQLKSPAIRRSIEFLTDTLGSDLERDWPIGPRGHALRALSLYYQRVYGGEAGQMETVLTAAVKKNQSVR
jgi:hypothetical protein